MRCRIVTLAGCMLAASAVAPASASELNGTGVCAVETPQFCLNGVSSAVTALDSLRAGVRRMEWREDDGANRQRRASLRPPMVAAEGNVGGIAMPGSGWGVWVSGNHGRFSADYGTFLGANIGYSADLDTLTAGVDRLLGSGRFLLGAALSHERMEAHTRYNAGTQESTGNTLMVYGSALLSDVFTLDLTAGVGRIDADQVRVDPLAPVGTFLRSSYDAKRRHWSATLNAMQSRGAFGYGGRVGYLDSRERQDGYLELGGLSARLVGERTVKLGQLFAGVDASYGFAGGLQAHASVLYRRDGSRDDGRTGGGLPNAIGVFQPSDRDEFEWVVGLRYYGTRGLTLNVEYLKTSGRERFKNESIALLARFDF